MHGYGSNEEDLFDLALTLDKRFKVFSLRAPIAMDNGGFAWYPLQRDIQKGISYDYKQARESVRLVKAWISKTCKAQQLDSNRVYLMGFSQGSMMAYDLALSYPGRIKGLLALSGKLMPESRKQLKPGTTLSALSVFIGHGSQDNLIPESEANSAFQFFKQAGTLDLEQKSYPILHSINGKEVEDIRAFLLRQLDKGKPQGEKKKGPTK